MIIIFHTKYDKNFCYNVCVEHIKRHNYVLMFEKNPQI